MKKRKMVGYTKAAPKYRWRDFLSDEEADELAMLEKREKRTAAQKYRLQLLRTRGVNRARYAQMRKT